jgi:hypothetical protein
MQLLGDLLNQIHIQISNTFFTFYLNMSGAMGFFVGKCIEL